RAERAEAARFAHNIRHGNAPEEQKQEVEVGVLATWLFHSSRGQIGAYPHRHAFWNSASYTNPADGTGGPTGIVRRLEATAGGARWLLDRWTELGAVLEKGQSWGPPDKLKAIRLLGKQPMDAAPDPEVALIFLACHVIEPLYADPFHE